MASGKTLSSIATLSAITTADADATFGQPEADLVNEIKTDLNTLIGKVNTLIGELKARGWMGQ
jgi:uncharacterized metal-binding protein